MKRPGGRGLAITADDYEIVDAGFETPCHVWKWRTTHGTPILKTGGTTRGVRPLVTGARYNSARCGNARCINPAHQMPKASQTERNSEIIRRLESGKHGMASALALEYGISRQRISQIRQRGY